MSDQAILEELIRRVTQLEQIQEQNGLQVPLFSIVNVNTPAQITANQNDYDPGNYELIRLSTNASRNITGFAGGTKGRLLWITNIGAQNIVLVNNSGLSVAANRIFNPGGGNITMTPIGTGTYTSVLLIYQLTGWVTFFRSAP